MHKVLRLDAVKERTGLPTSTIYDMMTATPPQFPKPIRIGIRAVGWLETEINEYIAGRIAERDGKAA